MPRMDGLAATVRDHDHGADADRHRHRGAPGPAMSRGRSTCSASAPWTCPPMKPPGPNSPGFERESRPDGLDRQGDVTASRWSGGGGRRPPGPCRGRTPPAVAGHADRKIVAIAASTGGPPALRQRLLAGLPPSFVAADPGRPAPSRRVSSPAWRQLARQRLPAPGQGGRGRARPLALRDRLPGARTTGTSASPRAARRSSNSPTPNSVDGFRPSGTPPVRVGGARHFRPFGSLAVILTGMGRDGVRGPPAPSGEPGAMSSRKTNPPRSSSGCPPPPSRPASPTSSCRLITIPARLAALTRQIKHA